MAIPFTEKKDFSNRLKGKDIHPLDKVEILSEGEWQADTFKDGTISKGFWIKVKYKGQEKELKISRASFENIAPVWGDDTRNWIGKTAVMMVMAYEKGKGIVLTPQPDKGKETTAWDD